MAENTVPSKYTLCAGEYSAVISNYGATVMSLCVPAADGSLKDIILGYDNFEAYAGGTCHHGGVIGRNGNRIANGRFTLNGRVIQMPINENTNNLHSGPDGFEYRIWNVEEKTDRSITLSLHSPDGDQNLPGSLDVRITYQISEDGTFSLTYEGISDADTIFNMTNHSYFNLNGHDSGSILDQVLQLNCSAFSEVMPGSIPTGKHVAVDGTVFDFRTPHSIGERINADDEQLKLTGGYDHNYFADGTPGEFRKIASACSPASGILMEVFTDLPCVQFYAGNFIKEEAGKGGAVYGPRTGFCLETQYCPDAVNQPGEIQPVIRGGQRVRSQTAYRFRRME